MARSVQIQVPVQHAGLARPALGAEQVGTAAAHIVLGILALIGKPVTAAGAAVRRGLAAWSQARKQRIDDEKLWNLALQDARIMADLSRAMSQDALRETRGYF